MRLGPIALLAALLPAGLAGCFGPPCAFADTSAGSAPPLAVGTQWTFLAHQGTSTSESIWRIGAVEEHRCVRAHRIDTTYSLILPGGAVSDTPTEVATVWESLPDEAMMEFETRGGTTTYTPPCPRLHWPLVVGASWQESCSASAPARDFHPVGTYLVGGRTNVTVPAGRFDVFVVQFHDDEDIPGQAANDSVLYIAASGCLRNVKTTDAHGSPYLELTSYTCG
ncbi:MAG: hypothetical protein V4510_02685 [bacterium]